MAMCAWLLLVLLGGLYLAFVGYPTRRFAGAVLDGREQAIVAACAETMFPSRDTMPLTGIEAGVVEYLDRHLASLPKDKRLQIRLLIAFIEQSPWVFGCGAGFFGRFSRFSKLDSGRRQAFLADMAKSSIYFRRVCFLSLRALLCMAYLSHPAIEEAIGMRPNLRPFASEGRP